MRDSQLEAWALAQNDRVVAGLPIEDNRVELKAEWPSKHHRAARQIAGLANAARGEHVLWLIGLDEDRGLVGASNEELSDWWAGVTRCFDEGIHPALHALNVPVGGGPSIVALLFTTSRAPFVVKNKEKVILDREVPWREGNATRTARRSDLIRLLVPTTRLPEVEVVSGSINVASAKDVHLGPCTVHISMDIYITSIVNDVIVIPFHRCGLTLLDGRRAVKAENTSVSLYPPQRLVNRSGTGAADLFKTESESLTIAGNSKELVVSQSGAARLEASFTFDPDVDLSPAPPGLSLNLRMEPVGASRAVVVAQNFRRDAEQESYVRVRYTAV
jgi:hypothetical protein